jgi:hypothetical protein
MKQATLESGARLARMRWLPLLPVLVIAACTAPAHVAPGVISPEVTDPRVRVVALVDALGDGTSPEAQAILSRDVIALGYPDTPANRAAFYLLVRAWADEYRQQLTGEAAAALGAPSSFSVVTPSSGLLGSELLGPMRANAYGPGINSDATGRPFTWQPTYGAGPALCPITPNAYGPGIRMDGTGRPVRAQPWP